MKKIQESVSQELTRCFIGLGSNIEPRLAYLSEAVEALEGTGELGRISSVYETAPVGGVPQPDYFNAVVEVRTRIGPLELVHRLKALERSLGRTARPRWHEREIDLDLLFYGDLVLQSPELTLPHPEIPRRAFVLVPLTEIAADFVHPVLQRTIRDLRDETGAVGVKKTNVILRH